MRTLIRTLVLGLALVFAAPLASADDPPDAPKKGKKVVKKKVVKKKVVAKKKVVKKAPVKKAPKKTDEDAE